MGSRELQACAAACFLFRRAGSPVHRRVCSEEAACASVRPACLFACRAQPQSVAVEGALKKSDGSDGGYSHPDISPSGVTAFLDAGDQAKEKNQGAEAALEDIKNFTGHFDGTPP